ncbi:MULTISPECIES: CHAT domain-containing protein [unclassified Streptomyces]|uniref:CHAT domain-containing protein n=1 Tax=unclassified Streptomyces TaxID=2593676 RepID=UPI00224DA2FE|nr:MULTISPECIES: CHAT domain-containing protein [unclassified Streptomyces]MCX4650281.1 CHAT domain-containing protein [Streptomyces sp. NBC_01446]MCX5321598.1 CHAT domain-containing protein [Streptomyces sp. NBC_00120]MCX5323872.1 CHAT domain-containing protein [Streptomyces sp. NBC_00120]MCX5327722.1 CHAT domain-containing protein [Streptomyces sp. NBC_00120]
MQEGEVLRQVRADTSALHPLTLIVIGGDALENMRRGIFSTACVAARLAMTAAEPRWGVTRSSPWWLAADVFNDAMSAWLVAEPDGSRFAAACQVTDQQIEALREEGDHDELAATLTVAGGLRLGPYLSYVSLDDPVARHDRWRTRERRRNAVSTLLETLTRSPMPKARHALRSALPYFEEAAALTSGHRKANNLRNLAQAYARLAELDVPDAAALRRKATEAMRSAYSFVDATEDPLAYLHVSTIAWLNNEAPMPTELSDILPVPLGELFRTRRTDYVVGTAHLALSAARYTGNQDLLREVIASIRASLTTTRAHAKTDIDIELWHTEVHALPGNTLTCRAARKNDRTHESRLRRGAGKQRGASGLIHLAAHASEAGDGVRALRLIDQARVTPDLYPDAWPSVLHLTAWASMQAGDSCAASADPLAAIGYHCGAAWRYLVLGHGERAAAAITGLVREAGAGDGHEYQVHAVGALGVVACYAPRAGDRSHMTHLLYEACQALSTARTGKQVAPYAHLMLHRVGKGMEIDCAAHAPGPRPMPEPVREWLREATTSEGEIDRAGMPPSDPWDGMVASLSYLSETEADEGATPTERVDNMWRVFDRQFTATLTPPPARSVQSWMDFCSQASCGAIDRIIPEDTVLISFFAGLTILPRSEGKSARPMVSAHRVTLTHEGAVMSGQHFTDLVSPLTLIGAEGRNETRALHPFAGHVGPLHDELAKYPGFDEVTDEALRLLDARTYFGNHFASELTAWREQGKRHLCIWPHGPMHRLPFHLMQVDGSPLADHWTVTTIQGLHSIERATVSAEFAHGHVIAASAVGGVNFGLHEEVSLEEHARAVADQVGVVPMVGEDATRANLLQAMPAARFIHIAAHGSRDDIAGWRQCLYLTPSADSDGRLYAHDVLGLDLRGVDIVTLSACESTSYRFDILDNHRGIAPAFLVAGAATVVGCLWKVHPAPATHFFRALHDRLHQGVPKLEAFRAAQQATRERYPEYRHWGAFSYIGAR